MGSIHDQATIISLDTAGKLSVETPKKKRSGVITGALVGVLAGAALGVPVVGVVLGGVVSARRAGKKKQSGQGFSLDQVTELMAPDSSIIAAEIEDWRVGTVMSTLQMHNAKLVLHTSEAELAQAIADVGESSDPNA